MKINLIKYLFKESIRTNTNRIKERNFYTYPFIIFLLFFTVLFFVFKINPSINQAKIFEIGFYIFLISGVMSGAFGMYARDYLERKYGDFGNLISNSLILPIKLKRIFFSFAISDMLFYLIWFIIPVILSYALVLFFFGQLSLTIISFFIAQLFIFLCGFLGTFFLSMLFERSKIIFTITLSILTFFIILFFLNGGIIKSFIYDFSINSNFINSLYLILSLVVMTLAIFITIGREYRTKFRVSKQIKSISFNKKLNHFLLKDFIDLKRTKGLFGVPFFIIFLPAILLLLLFLNVNNILDLNINILFFSIIIGMLCVSLFNSLMSSDNVSYYRFLPVKLEEVVKSKIKVSVGLSLFYSIIVLLGYAFYNSDFVLFFQAIIVFLSMLIYNFNLNFLLTGLNPNEKLLDSSVLIKYFILLFPLVLLFIILNSFFTYSIWIYFVVFIFILLLSKLYFFLGIKRWNKVFLYN